MRMRRSRSLCANQAPPPVKHYFAGLSLANWSDASSTAAQTGAPHHHLITADLQSRAPRNGRTQPDEAAAAVELPLSLMGCVAAQLEGLVADSDGTLKRTEV